MLYCEGRSYWLLSMEKLKINSHYTMLIMGIAVESTRILANIQ
jgi:hypothetical protein